MNKGLSQINRQNLRTIDSIHIPNILSVPRVSLQPALVTRLVGRLRSDDLYTVLPHYPGESWR